jgi:hypothetical protein
MDEMLPRMRRHWLEYVVTIVALAVSVISLWVAIGTEDANRKMVAASSWPLLQAETGNSDDANRPDITLAVANSGIGPAKLKTLEIFWKGKAYRGSFSLLSACCGFKAYAFPDLTGKPAHTPMSNAEISGIVIRAGETRTFLSMPLGPDNTDTWNKFNNVRWELVYRACYCSVFDECWVSTLRHLDARRIDSCPDVADSYTE